MRRIVTQRITRSVLLLAATAGVLMLLQPAGNPGSVENRIIVEGSRRVVTYELEKDNWLKFGLLPAHRALRLVTTANLNAETISSLPNPTRANYVVEYVTIDVYGVESESKFLHETAYLDRTDTNMTYLDAREIPASGQLVLFDLASRPLREIHFRTHTADDAVSSVGIRANAEEAVSERETGFRWQRLRRDQQAALFRGSVYPPEFARRSERRRLTRTRWVPLGPSGIGGRDFHPKILYVEDESKEIESEQLLTGAGLFLSPETPGVVPIPPGGGDVTLRFLARAGTEISDARAPDSAATQKTVDLSSILTIAFYPAEPGETEHFKREIAKGAASFSRPLPEGEIMVKVPFELTMFAEVTDPETAQIRQITPQPGLIPTWIAQNQQPLNWQITTPDKGKLPVRLDLRIPLPTPEMQNASANVSIIMKDGEGNLLHSTRHSVEYEWEPFERGISDRFWRFGAAKRLFFLLPNGTEELLLESDQLIAANLYIRPPTLPHRVRVPIDYSSFPIDPPRPLIWFGLFPEEATQLILDHRRQLLAASTRVEEPNPALLSGDFDFVLYPPEEITLGRDLLIANRGDTPVRAGSEGNWFRPLRRGDQTLQFIHESAEMVTPDLIWRSSDTKARLKIEVDGQTILDESLTGSQGVIQLGRITAGSHKLKVDLPDSMTVYINYAGKGFDQHNPIRLRRFATRLRPGMKPLNFNITKTLPVETVTLALYRSGGTESSLTATLGGQQPEPRESTGYTPRTKVFSIAPAVVIDTNWVIGTSELTDEGQRMFFTMNEDVPAGDYRLNVDMGTGLDGYLSVYQLQSGDGKKVTFDLDRVEDAE